MKMIMLMAGAAICLATPALAMSNSDMTMMTNYMMMKADTNGDGMVSKDEMMKMDEQKFAMMDANHDGMLSKDEMMAGMKMQNDEMMKMTKSGGMMDRGSMGKSSMMTNQ